MKKPQKYKRNFRRPPKDEIVEWDISQEQVDKMVEEFLVKKREEEAKNPPKKVEPREMRSHAFNFGSRGRPRKNLTKLVTMVKAKNGLLVRANRGRPGTGEIRVKVEVPHDLIVQRSPITYKINKSGELVKATKQPASTRASL